MGILKIKTIVSNCRLGNAFMQWCIAYAAQSNFAAVPDQLRRLLRDTFSGWTQSRINEKANKVWRDLGNRANASGIASMTALWEKLTDAGVLDEFERTEISTDEGLIDCGDKPDFDIADLFVDPKARVKCDVGDGIPELERVAQENAWLSQFDKIRAEEGKSFNPASEQKLVSELRLLRKLHEENLWHKANDAWVTSLLPVGGLIRVKSSNTHLWVLRADDSAALCWPAEQVSANLWRKAKGVKELIWYHCFNLDDVEVLPVRVESPKSLFLQERLTLYNISFRACQALLGSLLDLQYLPRHSEAPGTVRVVRNALGFVGFPWGSLGSNFDRD